MQDLESSKSFAYLTLALIEVSFLEEYSQWFLVFQAFLILEVAKVYFSSQMNLPQH